MKKPHSPAATAAELRQRAEERLRAAPPVVVEHDEAQRLLHELRVHRIELELQNEDLLQSRAALEASAEKYADLYDFAPVSYLTLDLGGTIREANLTAATYLGVDRAQLIGQSFPRFLAPESSAPFRAFLERTATTDTKEACEVTLPKKDGPPRRALLEGLAFADGSGEGRHCRLILHDITERKKEADILSASEARFRALFDHAAVGMCLVSMDGEFLRTNCRFCEIVGYSAEELLTRTCIETTHPDDRAREAGIIKRMLAGEFQSDSWEKRYVHKDGRVIWCNLTLALIPGQAGEARQFVGVIDDITGRRQAAEERDRMFNLSIDLLSVGTYEGRLEQVNPAWTRCLGWSAEELTSLSWLEFVHPDDHPATIEAGEKLSRGESLQDFQNRYRCKDGSYRRLSWNSHPLPETRQIFGVCRDVTVQHRRQEQLRLLENCVSRINDIILITEAEPIDEPGPRILYVNDAFVTHTGFTREEAIGQTPRLLQGPKTQRDALDRIRAAMAKWQPCREELINYTKGGEEFWLELDIVPVADASGWFTHWVAIQRDITERKKAEGKLRQLSQAVEQSPVATVITDRKGNIEYVNEIFLNTTGYTMAEVKGKNPRFLKGGGTTPQIYRQLWETITAGRTWRGEFHNRKKSGDLYWEAAIISPVLAPDGQITHFLAIKEDITERKNAEEMLRQNQTMLRIAGRAAKLGGWSIDLPDNKVTWSDETAIIHDLEPGYSPSLEEGIAFYPPECRDAVAEHVRLLTTDGIPWDFEHELITARQRRIWVRSIGEALRDDAGQILRLCGAFQDITEHKQSEIALKDSNRALQLLSRCNETLIRSENEADLLHDICRIAVDLGGFRLAWVGYAQDDAEKSIKLQAHSGAGQEYLSDLRVTWSAEDPNGQGPVGTVIRSGEPLIISDLSRDPGFAPWYVKANACGFAGIFVLPLKNQTRTFGVLALYTAEARYTPHDNEISLMRELADDLAFGIGSLRSQSDHRRMELAIRKMAVCVSTGTNRDFFCQLAGNMAEALGAEAAFVARLLPGQPRKALTIAAIVDGDQVENFEYEVSGNPCEDLLDNDDRIVPASVADLFPKAPALKELGAEAYCGRRLTNADHETVGFLFAIFRRPVERSEFIASTLQIFATRATAELERRKSDARLQEQASLLDKARDAIFVRDLNHKILYWNHGAERLYGWSAAEALDRDIRELIERDADALNAAFEKLMDSEEVIREIENVTKEGKVVIVERRCTLVRDEHGDPQSVLSINTDITERKNLEQQFLRAQRMESIGTLAGGIAHDLNNVLAPILMAIELLKMQEKDAHRLNILTTIETSSKRGADMVKQVLSFARGVEGQQVEVQAAHLLKEIKKLASETFPKNIQVVTDVPADLWTVQGDPTQLHQVLLNLCVNARDAMPYGGTLSLSAGNLMIDEHYAAMNIEARPGPHVRIVVEDTGTGMPPEVIDRIFEPFFTTKEQGKGTGLGLSTTLAIIKSHGGFIRAYSEMDVGTRFHVYLPAQTGPDIASTGHPKVELPRGQGQLILVVDDEAAIRQITQQTLEAFGYRVVLASDGAEAVSIYGVRQREIAVVLTDMMMPVMDGPATIRVLMRMNPKVRIIAASGLNANGMVAKAAIVGVKHFIPKPYTAETLLKTLQSVIHT